MCSMLIFGLVHTFLALFALFWRIEVSSKNQSYIMEVIDEQKAEAGIDKNSAIIYVHVVLLLSLNVVLAKYGNISPCNQNRICI